MMIPIVSVSEFIEQINNLVAGEFAIEGEISQYKISQSKWIFFDLKDITACLSCFSTVFMLPIPLQDGMRVRVVGYPKIHEKSGRFSFTVQKVEPIGQGLLQQAYVLLKAKLEREGLFDARRKRLLPRIPERIGVIASRDSAAWGDFKRIIHNRWRGVEIILCHTSVQGETAVADIVEALKNFNESKDMYDVLVLLRGGGSLEDLTAFNSEEIVRAIYASKIPVLSGIGHERDETLADLVADVRAATPTHAAQIIVPERKDFINQLVVEFDYIGQTLAHQIFQKRKLIEQRFLYVLSQFGVRIERIKNIIETFKYSHSLLEREMFKCAEFFEGASRLFKNVDPEHILKRGFSIIRKEGGVLVRSAAQVDKGEKIMIELAEGQLKGQVF
jgi:exodeoxyribonuclease VII large subunit